MFKIIRYSKLKKHSLKCYSNCLEKLDNPRLKIKFNPELKTRSLKKIKEYLKGLGMTDSDKFREKTCLYLRNTEKRNYFFSHKNQEIITCMSLEKFNEYVKMHNYLIIERTSL